MKSLPSFLLLFCAMTLASAEAQAQALYARNEASGRAAFVRGTSDSTQATPRHFSIGSAFLRSALIPGWGQRAAGAHHAARNFFVAEVGMWLGVLSFNMHGHWLKDDYRLLAAEHAAVDTREKSDAFYVDVGNYANIEDYNQSRLQRRDLAALYNPATHYWQWDTETNRTRFADLRLRSDKAFSRSELFIAAILGNHIISGIHAAWVTRKHHANEKAALPSASPQLGLLSSGNDLRLVAQVKF